MKQKFFFCKHCGNVVAKLHDRGTTYCCGERMQELVPCTTDASEEKHVPVYEMQGNVVCVTVGAAPHPMTAEHYIEWVCLETARGFQYVHLTPTDEPHAKFALCDGDEVRAVYAFCNQHALWKV